MKFKALQWERTYGNHDEVYLPFGLDIDVFSKDGRYLWQFGDALNRLKKGACATREKAMAQGEKAFHAYIEEGLEKILEK